MRFDVEVHGTPSIGRSLIILEWLVYFFQRGWCFHAGDMMTHDVFRARLVEHAIRQFQQCSSVGGHTKKTRCAGREWKGNDDSILSPRVSRGDDDADNPQRAENHLGQL